MMQKIFMVSLVFFMISCKKEYTTTVATGTKSSIKKVRLVDVEASTTQTPIRATGRLTSKDETILSFKIGGLIDQLLFEEGDQVAGKRKMAQLNMVEIDAQVKSAESAFQKAVRDFERAEKLYQDTVGTLVQKQNAETGVEVSKANLEIAQFNQEYATILAPARGVVLKRFVEKGELVSPGQPVFLLGSSGGRKAQVLKTSLTDKDIVLVQLNDLATITFDALPNETFSARIVKIAPEAAPTTGLFEVELALDQAKSNLRNGFIAKVAITPRSSQPMLSIPFSALVEGQDQRAQIFYTIDEQTVQSTAVRIVEMQDHYFIIEADELPKGAKVVCEGAPFLTINDTIQAVQ
ncbi:MAG: efflux RND transporter periplasmic adaptor subunit [Bacteroidota bacterium]